MPMPGLQYGLNAAIPPEATGSWGCRAIVTQDGYVDIVPDRTDQQGTTAIYELLNSQFSPSGLIEAIGRLLRSGQMGTRQPERFELHKSDTLTVAADTLASAGYCYVAAWTAIPDPAASTG